MGFKCGIIGLPNVGKSTIFNALTSAGAASSNYPFCTIDPNTGIVQLPDSRLEKLAKIVRPQKIVPTTLEFLDIAGLVKGASKGEGLGNQFLGHIRQVDAIAHVVRCFEDGEIVHVSGDINPQDDVEIIQAELILADIETLEKRIHKTKKLSKTGDKKQVDYIDLLDRVFDSLSRGIMLRNIGIEEADFFQLSDLFLLTAKPVMYVANVLEEDFPLGNKHVDVLRALARRENSEVVVISGKIESEIAELSEDEKLTFLEEMGTDSSGLEKMIHAGYNLLGLITYFTAGEKEVKAWTVPKSCKAPQAAGAIHTDFEKGFIRAEVTSFQDFTKAGGDVQAKQMGLRRIEGKEYVVHDGDIIHFLFNV